MAVPVHLYKVFILQMPTWENRSVALQVCSLCCSSLQGCLLTAIILSASFRTQWIIQQSFTTPPVLFCLLEYLPVIQHLYLASSIKSGEKGVHSGWGGSFLLILESYELTVHLCWGAWNDLRNPTQTYQYVHISPLQAWESSGLLLYCFVLVTKHSAVWRGFPRSNCGGPVPLTHLEKALWTLLSKCSQRKSWSVLYSICQKSPSRRFPTSRFAGCITKHSRIFTSTEILLEMNKSYWIFWPNQTENLKPIVLLFENTPMPRNLSSTFFIKC